MASYAAAQLIGAPLLGRLSDRLGCRPVLLLSVAGTFLGFLLLGFAAPLGQLLANWVAPQAVNAVILGVLFISRIIDGLTGGNLMVAQAYIEDVTDEQNRAKGLGLIGAALVAVGCDAPAGALRWCAQYGSAKRHQQIGQLR